MTGLRSRSVDSSDRPPIRLILTADDFGRDAACTSTIAAHLVRGRITATSIMANGSQFDEACELVRAHNLHGKVGVHLVLDEGPPLSRQMSRLSNGELRVSRRLAPMRRELAAAIEAECAAQIDRVLAAGISPTHLDSHRHIHTVAPIGWIVLRLARRYGIRYVRPARNLAKNKRIAAAAYKWMFNHYVSSRACTADYFADVVDMFEQRYDLAPGSLVECMVHLDESPRGVANQELLTNEQFEKFLHTFSVVGHAEAGY